MPHFSAVEAIKVALMVLVILGTMRIFALQHPNSSAAQAYLLLY